MLYQSSSTGHSGFETDYGNNTGPKKRRRSKPSAEIKPIESDPSEETSYRAGGAARSTGLLVLLVMGLSYYILFGANSSADAVVVKQEKTEQAPEKPVKKKVKKAKAETPKPKEKEMDIVMSAAPANPKDLPGESVQQYVNQWAPTAVREMHRTGIPASISLAQGIIESHAGRSILAVSCRNHFGLKCFEKHRGNSGHCMNFTDDIDHDFFKVFQNSGKSWEAHSELLKGGKRYRKLFTTKNADTWADGLQACGYATAKTYAKSLKKIMKTYNLYQYDSK